MVEEKRQLIELALNSARHYESSHTGLIHFCYEDESSRDTIPFFENLCFCLALLRSFSKDNVEEAKERLNHLLSFQNEEGNFPTYLHQYPRQGSFSPFFPLQLIAKHFPFIKVKVGTPPPRPQEIASSKDATLEALYLQLEEKPLHSLTSYWDPHHQIYSGPLTHEKQRAFAPDLTLFDLFMANGARTFSPRLLQPHPVHLQAALIFPTEPLTFSSPTPSQRRTLWQEKEHLHSLICEDKNVTFKGGEILYSEEVPEEKKGNELNFYVDYHPNLDIRVNGEKGTTFKLGDQITIDTPTNQVTFQLEKTEGEGDFFGHISRGNRPSQQFTDDFTAYDWKITLRTLRRSPNLRLKLLLSQTQERDCLQPHPSHGSHCLHKGSPQ